MKKVMKNVLAVAMMMLFSASAFAQYDWMKSSLTFGYTNESFSSLLGEEVVATYPNTFGLGGQFNEAFEIFDFAGRVVSVGLDTSVDLNYSQFDHAGTTHLGEFSVQVGPAVSFRPTDKLCFRAYAKIAPTIVGQHMPDIDKGYAGLGLMTTIGATACFGRFGLGVEQRGGGVTLMEIRDSKLNKDASKDISFVGPRFFLVLGL